jgi:hypothetical protein
MKKRFDGRNIMLVKELKQILSTVDENLEVRLLTEFSYSVKDVYIDKIHKLGGIGELNSIEEVLHLKG